MKNFRTILTAAAILFGAMTMSAQRMNYEAMRSNARFLTDRMAYELGIRSMSMIDDLYRINFDYIYGVNEYLDEIALGYYYDDYMEICARRDYAIRRLIGDLMWERLIRYDYFYRPITFVNRRWHFSIYDHDHYGMHHFFYNPPRHYNRRYEGGHYFHGMRPQGGHVISGHAGVPNRHGADMMHGQPQGGMRPQGGMNGNRPNGNMNERPHGGMDGNRPNGNMNERPNSGMNGNRPQGGVSNDHPQGGMNNNRPQGNSYSRPQGGVSNDRPQSNFNGNSQMRSESMNSRHSESGARSSARSNFNSNSSSRSNVSSPTRSSSSSSNSVSRNGATRGGNDNGNASRGGTRGGRR